MGQPPNGLEVREAPLWGSRPPVRAGLGSAYCRLAGKASVRLAKLGGSATPSC